MAVAPRRRRPARKYAPRWRTEVWVFWCLPAPLRAALLVDAHGSLLNGPKPANLRMPFPAMAS
eukprot:7941324-Pyramimonas_sp.AAC.1